MTYGESNDNVTDESRDIKDRGQVVTTIRLEPNISKTAGLATIAKY